MWNLNVSLSNVDGVHLCIFVELAALNDMNLEGFAESTCYLHHGYACFSCLRHGQFCFHGTFILGRVFDFMWLLEDEAEPARDKLFTV